MSHPNELLSAYLDGELYYAARREVEVHLDECGACRIELAQITETRAALRELPQLEAPPELFGREPRPAGKMAFFVRPSWAWATAGAAAAALVVGLAVGPGEPGTTVDIGTFADQHTARVVFEPGIATVRAVVDSP